MQQKPQNLLFLYRFIVFYDKEVVKHPLNGLA